MEPDQALNLLDRVAGSVSLPRQDHANIQRAVQVLAKLIVEYREVILAKEPPENSDRGAEDEKTEEPTA